MNEALVVAPPRSRLRAWLRYDESLEEPVDAAFAEFVRRSRIARVFAVSFLVAMPLSLALFAAYHNAPARYPVIYWVFYVCLFTPSLIAVAFVPGATLAAVLRGAANPFRSIALGFGAGLLASLLQMIVIAVLNAMHFYSRDASILSGGAAIALFFGVFAGPFVEESFFQGWMQARFEREYGEKRAVNVTSVVFVLYHLPRSLIAYTRAIPLFSFGLLRRETRSLAAPIAAHVTCNAIAVGLTMISTLAVHRPLHW